MRALRVLVLPVVCLTACAAVCCAQAGEPKAKATTQPTAAVPDSVIKNIEAQFRRPKERLSRDELRALYARRMQTVLKLGADAEAKYPAAENLHVVRIRMLSAAAGLVGIKKDEESQKTMLGVAQRLMGSPAPPETRIEADRILTAEKTNPDTSEISPPEKEKEIRAMVGRYTGTKVEPVAVLYGAVLAQRAKLTKLLDELADTLEAKHLQTKGVEAFLREIGRKMPFTAELTRLDGSKLLLPKDLLGKVVVIDFWATWCGPCLQEVPHMKKVYAQYKAKGVEMVGISLDKDKAKLAAFVKKHQMNWIHTFSGKGWRDPTAQRYGVRGIPSIWVLGPDGKVVSSNARSNLEATIEKALKSPKSK